MKSGIMTGIITLAAAVCGQQALAGDSFDCGALPNHVALQTALNDAVATETSGLDLDMWATIVDRDGTVCAVAHVIWARPGMFTIFSKNASSYVS